MPELTYLEAIRAGLREEMRRDPTVFIMGEDVGLHGGAFGVTKGLFEEFGPERVRNTPICENTIVGTALGAAMTGMRPVAEIMFADFSALAWAYGLANACVDGQDVLAVYDAVHAAVELARGGGGPSFVECQTYRFEGHYFGEPQVYRTREEVEEARRSRDPIARFGAVLVAEQGIPEGELLTLKARASQAVEEALAFAQESPEPPAEAYKEFVYA